MEPWHLAIATVAVILTIVGMGAGGALFLGRLLLRLGALVSRIETTGERVGQIEQRLDRIPQIEQRQEFFETRSKQHDEQIASLWRKVFSNDKRIAVVRAELGSQHDIGDTDPPPEGR